MKIIVPFIVGMLISLSLFSQELTADDRVNITQSTKPFIGVYAFGYQGLPTPGYPQFQLNNYGGIPGTPLATTDNSILGLFAFSGHNGSAKKTVGIIRVKSMDNFASQLSSRMDFLIGPNRQQRMTILGDSGYVGIGTETPTNQLDVNGQIRMRNGAIAGHIPVSDADGVMTWTDPTLLSSSLWEESGANINRPTGNVVIGTGNTQLSKLYVVEGSGANNTIIHAESTYTGSQFVTAVKGKSINSPGIGNGGSFEGGARGVYAVASASSHVGSAYGVASYAYGTAGNRTGVYGFAYNPGGSMSRGIHGIASGADINYGVYGSTSGSIGVSWAGYFVGNTYVSDTLTVEDRIHVNSDGSRTDRLVVMEANDEYAVYIENVNPSTTLTDGDGVRVLAGGRGFDVVLNPDQINGSSTGYSISNSTGSVELAGAQYGMYAYMTGARTSSGNYSIFGIEGSTAGSGTNWAGYFSGDVRITGTLDNTSDARLKKDIEDMDDALDIIKQLQPKTYEFRTDEFPHMALDERPQLGFIAQDMEKVLPQLVRTAVHPEFVNDEGEETDMPNSPAVDVKSINYIGIIPVLTQGIKELTTTVEEKEEIIENLISDNEAIKSEMKTVIEDNADLKTELANMKDQMSQMTNLMYEKINQIEKGMSSCCFDNANAETKTAHSDIELNGSDLATLEQNAPNPFNEQTIIKYYIPSSAQKASMTITDIKGSPLKSVNLGKTGLGTVRIHANELTAGTYIYTLYVDGKQIASKQMILIK